MGDLSENFSRWEFIPGTEDDNNVPIAQELVDGLEWIRAAIGGHPIFVTSGIRKYTNGVSLHERGQAADITCSIIPLNFLHEWAVRSKQFASSGIGLYPEQNFIHVDVGRVSPLRWLRIRQIYYYY